jgi:hypothetical protein
MRTFAAGQVAGASVHLDAHDDTSLTDDVRLNTSG